MNRQETALVCAQLSAAFPNWPVNKEMVATWHAFFDDIDGPIVLKAAHNWILTEQWPPSIAGIRSKCALELGALAPSTSEAWAEVMSIAVQYGIYNNDTRPRWSHELIRKTVSAIGYEEICQTDNTMAVRAQFLKRYDDFAQSYNQDVLQSINFEIGNGKVAFSLNQTSLPGQASIEADRGQESLLGEECEGMCGL